MLETGDCKTREILHFPPFRLSSLPEDTGYKSPELGLFDGNCNLTESEGIRPVLVLKGMAVRSHW